MNIYKISQDQNNDYDTYDSAIVVAKSEDEARRIHPRTSYMECSWHEGTEKWMFKSFDGSMQTSPSHDWASHIDQVTVLLVGKAAPGIAKGVLVASFNAAG